MFVSEVRRRIMWGDLDSLGIVFYPRYYEWIDAAGHLFFEKLGLEMDRLWHQHNLLFGLVETKCQYFQPGKYHQYIKILTSIQALGNTSLTLKYEICSLPEDQVMVLGFEKRVCLDVSEGKSFHAQPIPHDIRLVMERAWREDPPNSVP